MSMLDGSMVDLVSAKIMPSSSSLPQIGEGIIEWAVSSRNQKVRAHLYTALLNYIHLQPDSYSKESPDLTIDVTLDESASNLTLGGDGAGNMGQSATRILRKYSTSIDSIIDIDATVRPCLRSRVTSRHVEHTGTIASRRPGPAR